MLVYLKVNPFTDVSASSPFYKTILWAYENSITTGALAWADSNGPLAGTGKTFVPDAMSPRTDIITYLYRDLAA